MKERRESFTEEGRSDRRAECVRKLRSRAQAAKKDQHTGIRYPEACLAHVAPHISLFVSTGNETLLRKKKRNSLVQSHNRVRNEFSSVYTERLCQKFRSKTLTVTACQIAGLASNKNGENAVHLSVSSRISTAGQVCENHVQ